MIEILRKISESGLNQLRLIKVHQFELDVIGFNYFHSIWTKLWYLELRFGIAGGKTHDKYRLTWPWNVFPAAACAAGRAETRAGWAQKDINEERFNFLIYRLRLCRRPFFPMFLWFDSSIFLDLYGFSWISMDFNWFSLIFIDFCRFSEIFIDFRWFPWIFMHFHEFS